MMSMTLAYADNEENNAVENLQAYEMHVSMRSLGRALSLNLDQYDFVEDAMDAFAADLMTIATADGADRKAEVLTRLMDIRTELQALKKQMDYLQ